MSTGCQKVSQTGRYTESQADSMTVWQNGRAAKEPALVYFVEICFILQNRFCYTAHLIFI